uniref:Uncharacterized protein n=1 Tax=Clytia hemisphaerica TaxID=252671 RepID=A0A7M5XNI6_9CNID|eukprot:TCONS_00031245-protein
MILSFLSREAIMNVFKLIRILAISCTFQSTGICGGSLLCTDRKNITIIPHNADTDTQHHLMFYSRNEMLENTSLQLQYFIKSLLEDSCFEIWIYSPISNHCIRQTEENYVPFLQTEWMTITHTDDNEILDLLSHIPQTNDEIEQTLLFVSFQYLMKLLSKGEFNFGKKLKEIRQKHNIVILCETLSLLCHEGEKWLGNQKVIYGFEHTNFNPYLHNILLDLAKNPQHNWRERYTREIKSECKISNHTNVFIWNLYDNFGFTTNPEDKGIIFLMKFLYDFPINATIYYAEKHTFTNINFKHFSNLSGTFYRIPFKDLTPNLNTLSEISTKNTTGIIQEIKEIGGDNQVHVIPFFKETKPNFKQPPFTFNNTIRIIIDDDITESPTMNEEGDFEIWREDKCSPILISMLIEKICSILC